MREETFLEPKEELRQLRMKERRDTLVMNSRIRMQKYFNVLDDEMI